MEMSHERNLRHIHDSLSRILDAWSDLCVFVFLELIAFMAVPQAYLETKIRHIPEHLAIAGVEYSESVRREQCRLRIRRIERHTAERHSILHSDQGIVVHLKDPVELDCVQIRV